MKAITIRFSEEDINLVEEFRIEHFRNENYKMKLPMLNYSEAVRILVRRGAEKK